MPQRKLHLSRFRGDMRAHRTCEPAIGSQSESCTGIESCTGYRAAQDIELHSGGIRSYISVSDIRGS
jgi:hypothetical protein